VSGDILTLSEVTVRIAGLTAVDHLRAGALPANLAHIEPVTFAAALV
jgi:hypothetical protein